MENTIPNELNTLREDIKTAKKILLDVRYLKHLPRVYGPAIPTKELKLLS